VGELEHRVIPYNMIKNIGLIVLIIGLISGVFLVTSGQMGFFGKASEGHGAYPHEPLITNITENSFTLSYYTPVKAVKTLVTYGKDGDLDKVAYDDRGDTNKTRYTHYVTLKDLEPDTEYFVKIEQKNDGYPSIDYIKQKTAGDVEGSEPKEVSYTGTVIPKNENYINEGIVYLNVYKGQYLSVPLTKSGEFKIDLGKYRTFELDKYHEFKYEPSVLIWAATGLQGFSFYDTTIQGSKEPAMLYLENYRVPFSKVQLGEESTSQNWFDLVWSYAKILFGQG
jgi:hypothetical protein